jgi:hypothetical protein
MSTLLWATVPGGIVGTGAARQAVLRVLVTPRLDGGTLNTNGMDPWPAASLTSATLVADFAASPDGPVQQVEVMPPHIRPQPDVWGAFFPSNTIITPPTPHSAAAAQVVVDPTSETAKTIDKTFAATAATPLRLDHDDDRRALDNAAREQLTTNWSAQPPPRQPPPPTTTPSFQPPSNQAGIHRKALAANQASPNASAHHAFKHAPEDARCRGTAHCAHARMPSRDFFSFTRETSLIKSISYSPTSGKKSYILNRRLICSLAIAASCLIDFPTFSVRVGLLGFASIAYRNVRAADLGAYRRTVRSRLRLHRPPTVRLIVEITPDFLGCIEGADDADDADDCVP